MVVKLRTSVLLYDVLVTVNTAPHECVIRTGQPQTKAEKLKIRRGFIKK